MSYSVKGRFAIVTGSGSGIGHALVHLFLNAGCWVAVANRILTMHMSANTRPLPSTQPIRLTQAALDYWQQHTEVQGNLLFVASMGGYMHSMQTPLYFANKAALVSMVKPLSGLKRALGVRNGAICPGPAHTPIFEQEYCRDRLQRGDVALELEHVAELTLKVFQEPQYGDGNIVEIVMIGSKEEQSVHVREVGLKACIPTVGPLDVGTRAMAEEIEVLREGEGEGHAFFISDIKYL
ncbi:hypothetical protein FOZG_10559 [Fusarium oxysporum Fo47]|uniref:NAD(P)-binding protein n=1 Tax=Fusarium oxysporum Fo47 TaxID=660027 RepID=W9JWW2_FUSOX|nr:hypothetical protein FOZG_10559 [Fusarium oxysporum Fo47]